MAALGFAVTSLFSQSAPQVIDLRNATRPSVRLTALDSCPVTYGDSQELPEGLVSCAGAIRLPGGNVAIIDAGPARLLLFDANGKLITRTGRRGQGPGEFSGTPTLFPYRGDSLLVYNRSPGRTASFLVFSAAGNYARSFEMYFDPISEKRPSVVGASVRDGSISVATFASAMPTTNGRISGVDSLRIHNFDPDGVLRASTRDVPDVMWARDMQMTARSGSAGRGGSISMTLVSAGPVSRARAGFSLKDATLAVHGGAVFHFEEPNDALVVHAPDGRTLRRILLPPLAQRLRPAANRIVSQNEAQMLQILSDNIGRAWVELARDSMDGPRKWWIIDEAGSLVAEVLTPARQEILFAGDERVLLLRKDANDVQTVAQCLLVAQRE
jgi:hypothetical protein